MVDILMEIASDETKFPQNSQKTLRAKKNIKVLKHRHTGLLNKLKNK